MPLYEFECPKCGKRQEELLPHDFRQSPLCTCCNIMTNRVYSSFSYTFDFRDGWDVGLGEYVDTKSDRERFIREKGLMRETKPEEGRWV